MINLVLPEVGGEYVYATPNIENVVRSHIKHRGLSVVLDREALKKEVLPEGAAYAVWYSPDVEDGYVVDKEGLHCPIGYDRAIALISSYVLAE